MMTPQLAAMLQNNSGNAQMVSRIAQENGLSQDDIAQALKIPAEAAARYVQPAQAASNTMTAAPAMPSSIAGGAAGAAQAASNALGAGMAGAAGGMSGADIMRGGGGPRLEPAAPIGGMGSLPNQAGAAVPPPQVPTIAEQGMKPAAPPPPTEVKPVAKPGQMPTKPIMDNTALPPAVGGRTFPRPNEAAAEQAFRFGFDRMRGNVQ